MEVGERLSISNPQPLRLASTIVAALMVSFSGVSMFPALVIAQDTTYSLKIGRVIATVGKERITNLEYWRRYDEMYRSLKQALGDDFNEEIVGKLRLEKMVLDSLIEEKLYLIIAKERGFKVSNNELRESIQKTPAFQIDGVFDKNYYLLILQRNRLAPEVYEGKLREVLTIEKVRRFILEAGTDAPDVEDQEQTINNYLEDFKNKKKIEVEIHADRISR